jgi:ribose transport system substrate-binding protein
MRALVLAAAAGALLVAGCGSDDNGGGAASSSSSSKSGGANVAAAQAVIDKYSAEPTFTPPGPPIDAVKGMKGKKIMEIPVSSEIPIAKVLDDAMVAQSKRVGFELKVWENQGKPDQWVQGMEAAIAQHYDAIDLLAIQPDALKPQIEKARKAGIKVISSHLAGFGWQVPDFIDGAVRLPYEEAGQVLAAWAIVQTKGKADVLAIQATDQLSSADMIKGMKDVFARDCPDCELTARNVPTAQWASGVQKEVATGLQRDPNVNYIIPIFDAMTPFAIAGRQVAGKAATAGMASFNGTPFALDLVTQGKLDMNLGENEVWIAMAMLDAAMRAAMGEPVPTDTYKAAPLLVFTKDNVAQAGTPPDPAKGYGDAYEAGFDKLWGLSQ